MHTAQPTLPPGSSTVGDDTDLNQSYSSSTASFSTTSAISAGSFYFRQHFGLGGQSLPPSLSREASFTEPPPPQLSSQRWSKDEQREFERHIIRITASANTPFQWVQDREFRKFQSRYLPQSSFIGRKALSGRILNSELSTIREAAMGKAKGHLVTVQSDGWTGGNLRHFQAFMAAGGRNVRSFRFIL